MKNLRVAFSLLLLVSSGSAKADLYQIYFAENSEISSAGAYVDYVKIINTNSFTTYDGNISGFYDQSFSDLEAAAEAATAGSTYGAALNKDQASSPITILDFTGTNLKFRANTAVGIDPVGASPGDAYTYDIVNTVDLSTGSVTETVLIADTQAEYDLAVAEGYTVVLDTTDITRSGAVQTFTAFSTNITNENDSTSEANEETKGGLIVEQISGIDGASIFRQESDGTVHIGENSIVLSDESVSNSGYDQISSSANILELGNSSAHRTIVTGTLEIQDPTAPNHAATKRYADGIGSMSLALSMMPKALPGQSMMTAGMGTMGGQGAIALGLSAANESSGMSYNFGTAYNDTVAEFAFGAGIGWQF